MEIPEWLKVFEERLRSTWAPAVRDLSAAAPGVIVCIRSGTWGTATGANGYTIYLSCGWPEASLKRVDVVALSVSFHHVDSVPKFSLRFAGAIRVVASKRNFTRVPRHARLPRWRIFCLRCRLWCRRLETLLCEASRRNKVPNKIR